MNGTLMLGAPAEAGNTPLNTMQLDGLLTGNTIYILLPPGGAGGQEGGEASFFYGADGRAAAKLPSGASMNGEWRLESDHYCVSWTDGPQNSCTKLVKVGGEISMRDATTGEARGNIARLLPGNPEQL